MNSLLLYALLGAMVFFWSANFVIGKLALRDFPPLLLSGLRVTLAALFMIPVYWWARRKTVSADATRQDAPMLFILGVCGVALNQFFFVLGLSRTSVAHSAIFIGMTPILVLIIAAVIKQEPMTVWKGIGMGVAITGVIILNTRRERGGTGDNPTLLGDFLIVMASLTFALFTVFGKRFTGRHSSVTVNTFAYVGGALALSPLTVWQAAQFPFAHVSAQAWASLTYMALFGSVLSYLIYYYALAHFPASRVSALSYLQPILAGLMAATVIGERLTPQVIAGGSVILAGVMMTERG